MGGGGGIAGPFAGPGRTPAARNDGSRANPFGAPFPDGGLPEGGLNLSRPGAFTEGFKQVLAAREAAAQPAAAPAVREEAAKPAPCKDLKELRQALIKSLGRDRGLLASGIEKSLPWEWAKDPKGAAPPGSAESGAEKLLIPVRDTLTAGLLKKEYPHIRQILGDLWGKPLTVEVLETSAGDAPREPDLPPQAELVLRMFRGTVVKKRSTDDAD
jgi:DNA polymerase-3 subunit gamma/tau